MYTINPWGILVGIVLLDFLWMGGKKSLSEMRISLLAGALLCLTIIFLIATTTKT